MSTLGIMKGTTNAQRNAVVGSSSAVDKLTLTLADGTTQQHTVSDMIPKDAEPTSGSAKFVTSGAVKAALDEKVDKVDGKQLSTEDYTTPEKNKLAGISTGAQVNVIESVQVNGEALTPSGKAVNINLSNYATKGDVSSIPKFAVTVVTELPTSDISTSTIYLKSNGGSSGNSYDEYIYVNSAWEKIGTTEVDLSGYVPKTTTVNNKQLNTNITLSASDVGALPADGTAVKATADANGNNIANTYATQTALTNGLAGKQNALTFDSAPTSGSSNPVTSGGVFSAINAIPQITVDSALSSTSTNPVQNKAINTALSNKMDARAVDSTVTSGSSNLITSGAVYTAINSIAPGYRIQIEASKNPFQKIEVNLGRYGSVSNYSKETLVAQSYINSTSHPISSMDVVIRADYYTINGDSSSPTISQTSFQGTIKYGMGQYMSEILSFIKNNISITSNYSGDILCNFQITVLDELRVSGYSDIVHNPTIYKIMNLILTIDKNEIISCKSVNTSAGTVLVTVSTTPPVSNYTETGVSHYYISGVSTINVSSS